MDKGVFVAASGGLYSSTKLDVVANNLANVNTVGFKAERLVGKQQEFQDTLASLSNKNLPYKNDFEKLPGVVQMHTVTDFSPGQISTTGNPLDMALEKANHFFVVQGKNGDELTRAGNFKVDAQGRLVTADGYPVSGEGGPLTIPPGVISVAQNGVIAVSGQNVGKVKTVEVTDLTQLERVGGTRFKSNGAAPADVDPKIVTRSLEMANVTAVESMVELMGTQRGFDAYTKTARTIDELNERALRNARLSS
jgi:flagellar basal-body rod protein FlgF